MTAEIACEICVLGGGPAGSILARRLAELGHDTLLVDRTGTNDRPRAELLAPSILPILDSLRLRDDRRSRGVPAGKAGAAAVGNGRRSGQGSSTTRPRCWSNARGSTVSCARRRRASGSRPDHSGQPAFAAAGGNAAAGSCRSRHPRDRWSSSDQIPRRCARPAPHAPASTTVLRGPRRCRHRLTRPIDPSPRPGSKPGPMNGFGEAHFRTGATPQPIFLDPGRVAGLRGQSAWNSFGACCRARTARRSPARRDGRTDLTCATLLRASATIRSEMISSGWARRQSPSIRCRHKEFRRRCCRPFRAARRFTRS